MAEKEDGKKKGEETPAEETPAKSKKKLFIIVGAVVGLLLLIGVPLAIFTLKAKPATEETEELAADAATHGEHGSVPEGHDEEEELLEGEEPLGAFFPLDTFVVNLKGGRYLRMQAQLEFAEREIPQRFFSRTVLVRDAMINLLSNKAADELQEAKDKDALKNDIKDIVNEILKKEEVKKVYFTQFVVQ